MAWWVWGAILARSACQSAVVLALSPFINPHTSRQRLREWLFDGGDKAALCQQQVDVSACFAGLLRWVLAWWHTPQIALALDATLDRTRHAALVLSALYRGTAIPIAWQIMPANTPGAWRPHILALFTHVAGVIPPTMTVLVLVDRGLRMWIEAGFRVLKSIGWQWERTRRTDPVRVARHWLVLAVATVWTVATGTRVEDAENAGVRPSQMRIPRQAPEVRARTTSIFQLGITWLQQLVRNRVWTRLWPTPWPDPPEGLQWVLDL